MELIKNYGKGSGSGKKNNYTFGVTSGSSHKYIMKTVYTPKIKPYMGLTKAAVNR